MTYAELHLHTAFSFLDGASLPEELAQQAALFGYQSLAVTDHDGLYGAMEFAQAVHAVGMKPITGAEITLKDDSHLTLIATNRTGYGNLCRLLTESHRLPPANAKTLARREEAKNRRNVPFELRGIGKSAPIYRPEERLSRVDPTLLRPHSDGLILLTGCRRGNLSQLAETGRMREAAALLQNYIAWFGETNVYVELQHNLVYGDTQRCRLLASLANDAGLPIVATGNVHYHRPERHRLQDVLVSIHNHETLDSSHQARRPNARFALRDPAEVAQTFSPWSGAVEATLEIAVRCTFNLATDLTYTFPAYPTPPGVTPERLLTDVCQQELKKRYDKAGQAKAQERLDEELAIITKHRLAGFFLLYRDLLILAKEVADEIRGSSSARTAGNLPPGRGRGSSVSSIVCYLIGLSHVDPIKHDLFFGRFLNDELHSIPDIDLDFPREIRERLIERVYEVFGVDHAALVCAFSTYKLRSAVRDIGKTLGLPLPELDKIAKLSEPRSARDLAGELDYLPGYSERKHLPPWCYLIDLAEQLAGFPRHVTQHAGGMIVSSTPLSEFVPIEPAAMEGRFICHWDKDSCEDAGVVKIDFLALGMLSLVEECLEMIAGNGKPPVDLSRVDFNDTAIYDMICEGDTIGVFQIESRAQIQMLPRTRPRKLEDLIVEVAIVRPGPIIGGAVKPYVAHRERERTSFLPIEPHYDHPLLEPVLQETHGVILYQEQVIQVAMELAGFSAGQADALRRSMSRKRSRDAMLQLWDQFRDGALARDVPLQTAKEVFQKLLGFASYGFPKAHAAAFAVLAYQSCWLRYYHRAEFTCALLNNQPMGFYPPHVLINDAKRHRLRVLHPDINVSGVRCAVESNAIRIGLGYVQGLGQTAAQQIVIERDTNGPFYSLADFVRRLSLKTDAIEHLVLIGAFDRFGLGRREALWMLGLFTPVQRSGQRKNGVVQQLPLALPVKQDMVELSPMGAWDQMSADYDILGLSPRYHPLGLLRPAIPESFATTIDLETLPNGTIVNIAGLVVCRQRPGTAKGITFLLLEDERGLANVIVYRDLYLENRLVVRGEPFLSIEGRLQRQEEGPINVIATRISPLATARNTFGAPAPTTAEDAIPVSERENAPAPASHNYR